MEAHQLLAPVQPSENDVLECIADAESSVARSSLHPSPFYRFYISITRACYFLLGNTSLRRRNTIKRRHRHWPSIIRGLLWIFAIFILISILRGVLHPSYTNPPIQYQLLEQRIAATTKSGRGNVRNEKIFIAANIINAELIRGAWGRSMYSLVDLLGEENVFVSIYENDSGSDTQDALEELGQKLPCLSSIVRGDHLPLSSLPTVRLVDGTDRVQRITYLAELRNRLLRPLDPTFSQSEYHVPGFRSAAGLHFDKILFLNDIYFSPSDAAQLLFSTNAVSNGQARYRAACAVDFVNGVMFHDSFVVRDTDGYGMGLMFYPWFPTTGSGTSRQDVRSETDSVRVRSCWGGMAAFDAAVFRSIDSRTASTQQSQSSSLTRLDDSASLPAIQFRSSHEAYWEAAECCLIFADLEARYGPADHEGGTGVFINPYIRVAYTQTSWKWLDFHRRFERVFEYLQFIVSSIGYPEFNPRRAHPAGEMVNELVWSNSLRGHPKAPPVIAEQGQFSLIRRRAAPGGFCGQRRMFVMKNDYEKVNKKGNSRNWEKIKIPWR